MYAALLNEELVTAVAVFARDSQSIQEQNFVCPNCRKPVQLIVSGRSGPFFLDTSTRAFEQLRRRSMSWVRKLFLQQHELLVGGKARGATSKRPDSSGCVH